MYELNYEKGYQGDMRGEMRMNMSRFEEGYEYYSLSRYEERYEEAAVMMGPKATQETAGGKASPVCSSVP